MRWSGAKNRGIDVPAMRSACGAQLCARYWRSVTPHVDRSAGRVAHATVARTALIHSCDVHLAPQPAQRALA
jgi:hypothetical protein